MHPIHSLLFALGLATPALATCPDISGDLNITYFGLYPEGGDWDPVHCKAYIGLDFNGTVLVWDPYTDARELISFDGVTGDNEGSGVGYRVGGIDYDAVTGSMYIDAAAAIVFNTSGANLTGNNKLIRYDTNLNKTLWIADTQDVQDEIQADTGLQVNGFQDMAEDLLGNSYYVPTFGRVVLKVDKNGVVSQFITPDAAYINNTAIGYTGLASLGSKLIIADTIITGLVTVDTTADCPTTTVVDIKDSPDFPIAGTTYIFDGVYVPPKYNNTVLLVSEDIGNQVLVFTSDDEFVTATYKGAVNNTVYNLGTAQPTWTMQMADSIYLGEFFNYDVPRISRSVFPLLDITSIVDGLVNA